MIVFFTGKRKYFCRDCNAKFRAVDRRQTSRESVASEAARGAKSFR
jgi:hypothetical protein